MSVPTAVLTPTLHRHTTADQRLLFRLSAAAVLLLAVAPLASFALCGFLLVNLSSSTPRQVRWVLGLATALSLSMMAGARPLDPDEFTDINAYYEIYQAIAGGDLSDLTRFGGGFEMALPLLMLSWATVLPHLSINGLMFCLGLSSSLLLVLWVENAFYNTAMPPRPALLGICLVLLNIYFSTQLSRQFLSLIVLLFACTATGRGRRMLFVSIAACFHLTAVPFYALYLLARRGWAGWIAIVIAAFLLRVYFADLLAAFDVLPEAATEKLAYYLDNTDEWTDADIASLRMIVLLGGISLVVLLASRLRPDALTRKWLAVPWITAVVHYLLLPIPLASLRATLVVHSVASGFLAYKMLSGRTHGLLIPALNVLLFYKVGSFAGGLNGANVRSTLNMATTFFN